MRSLLGAATVVLLSLAWGVEAARDFYKILGVDRDATSAEIKRAYKKMSMKYHPDKNQGDASAAERFAEVAEVYEVLNDEDSRRRYDQFGEEGVKNGGGGGFHGGDPFDIFAQFFGGGGGGGGGFEKPETRGPAVILPLQVTLAELYVGHTIEVDVSKQVLCDHCHGSGAENPNDVTTCPECQGQGMRVVRQMLAPGFYQTMHAPCDHCDGKGKVVAHACSVCGGAKVQRSSSESLTVHVTPGMPQGHPIVFEREGDHSPDWDVPGPVVFKIETQPHRAFTRDGHDLHLNYTISLLQSLNGFETSFTHLDKLTRVTLKRSGITSPATVEKVASKGMPVYHAESDSAVGFGDLYVHYHVEFPESLTNSQKVALKQVLTQDTRARNNVHDEL
ncbi:DnaJ-domain-containing protein [Dimargaris cristalligena]|uniref:DnaJ-domain-containing protein n=1 Tax=Dimargaris cristalligena TaxID=215637 RepID=A0A4Q0A1Z0_9FUNG|nr:DnaJ-domain-containing protein [Dimargaris cristalligena]|eukprot:RKP39322.1 DnaJ-domain-containing protein [Dimargaris cristalligena]